MDTDDDDDDGSKIQVSITCLIYTSLHGRWSARGGRGEGGSLPCLAACFAYRILLCINS
jgi:hypothetical protein